ncbi:chemotaxis protein [Yersinia sp. Marseille-Q3913]|uniref:chemotaxis protein n=1 Tax=Yersinia sp. Marseille-Q3913 TaxID=2830769 RepID=UPI001BAF3962|nr:chemotaxis protein [Yersinia sp. Marseille-Q3913]MBS0056522.1 chemotaxis protein [Yersinia sp. Marseille-Q3913]
MSTSIYKTPIPEHFSTHPTKSSGYDVGKSSSPDASNDADDIFSQGLSVLYSFLDVLKNLAATDFKGMQSRSKYARDVQDNANQVDEVIAKASKGDDKTREPLPDSVIKFMRENGIKVDGMSIDDYLKKNGPTLGKGELEAVKGALDNAKTSATDSMTQDQLQLQKLMQSYNVCANNISTLQSGLKDLLMTISRNFC